MSNRLICLKFRQNDSNLARSEQFYATRPLKPEKTLSQSKTPNQDDNKTLESQGRRTALKATALATGTVALAGNGLLQAATAVLDGPTPNNSSISATDLPLSEFTVQVRHSWSANDIEVVLTNTGSVASTITDMTPSTIQVARGKFDFQHLLKDGPITLNAGESISVPLQHEMSAQTIAGLGHFDYSLQKQLRNTVSIVTERDALAAVTIPNSPQIV